MYAQDSIYENFPNIKHPYAQTITHSYTKHGLHFKLFKLHYTKRKENEHIQTQGEVADSIYEIFSEIFHLNGLGAAAAMRCRLCLAFCIYLRNNRITLWLCLAGMGIPCIDLWDIMFTVSSMACIYSFGQKPVSHAYLYMKLL